MVQRKGEAPRVFYRPGRKAMKRKGRRGKARQSQGGEGILRSKVVKEEWGGRMILTGLYPEVQAWAWRVAVETAVVETAAELTFRRGVKWY